MTRHVPASAGDESLQRERIQKWIEALAHMRQALEVMDESDAPAHAGAHLDLAIIRLNEAIEAPGDEQGS